MNRNINCPTSYEKHQNACYRFGSHSSYSAAQAICESDEARLVDVNPINNNYVKRQVKSFGGGNDFWIGSYFAGGRRITRKGPTGCPIMRGQKTPGGSFARVDCNPSYRFVCQKYGRTRYGSNRPTGTNGFNSNNNLDFSGIPGEEEVPVTRASTAPPASSTVAQAASPTWPAIVLPLVGVLVLIVALRFYCKRRSRKRLEKHKEMLRKEQEKKKAQQSSPGAITAVSRNTSMNKPCNLPVVNGPNRTLSTISRSQRFATPPKFNGSVKRTSLPGTNNFTTSEMRLTGRRNQTEIERSPSFQTNLHGVHRCSPSPPCERRYSRYASGRRRSRSRRRSTSYYSDSSRSSSVDSALSSISDSSFRRSRGRRSSNCGHHRRSRTPTLRKADEYYASHRDRRRRSRSRSRQRNMTQFERYAAGQPPLPAHELLMRQGAAHRGGNYREFGLESHHRMTHTLGPASQPYFPQMTNVLAWSEENLARAGDSSFPGHGRGQQRPFEPRFPRPDLVRVNRQIHDFEKQCPRQDRPTSADAEHVYESLDDFAKHKRDKSEKNGSGKNSCPPEGNLIRETASRCSERSRTSMRGRKLPATPQA